MNKKIASEIAIGIILLLAIIIGGIFYWQNKDSNQLSGQKACTEEAKLCADGTYVSRTGPNCEFAKCTEADNQPASMLGSDKDKRGCIGSAGYAWCEAKQKCLRSFEESCEKEMQEMQIPADWKTFTAPMGGFTLRYPKDWKVVDNRDDGDEKCSKPAPNCIDFFYINSPDGVYIEYTFRKYDGFGNTGSDKLSCGVQYYCDADKVLSFEKFNVLNYGDVYLIRHPNKKISLHKPVNPETIPVIGETKHDENFETFYSLDGKNKDRYTITIEYYNNDKFKEITDNQFLNMDSVKKAEIILKSLKY